MITSRALVERTPESMRLIRHHESETLRSIQLYGVDPKTVIEAVTMLVAEDRADHIDLNFGCPVAKVTRRGGGAALPWKLGLFREIVEGAVKAAGDVPVTVKMRKGIDEEHLTYLEAGRAAEGAGAASIALHARTAAEYYSGTADWNAITELKNVISSTPVLGNGDIWSAEDAVRMVEQTGCDGVVVGRGCLGRPWLFGDLAAAFGGADDTTGEVSTGSTRTTSSPTSGSSRMRSAGTPSCSWSSSRTRTGRAATSASMSPGTSRATRSAARPARRSRCRARCRSSMTTSPSSTATQPYPGAEAEGQRGRAGAPKRPTLPYGWLDSRELQETDVADMVEGEVHNSGG